MAVDATAQDVLSGTADWCVECGDALDLMRRLPGGCVQCVCTSPPFYGLRSYLPDGHPDKAREIGLEQTPDAYVARLVEVFGEVKRVLRDDGVAFVNVGDSYAGGGGGNYTKGTRNNNGQNVTNVRNRPAWLDGAGLKAKDLIGVPWRVAFALQADGWYLRAAITWCKVNPMCESCRDRPTRATEMVFVLTKKPTYFYDQEAERVACATPPDAHKPGQKRYNDGGYFRHGLDGSTIGEANPAGRNLWDWWGDIRPEPTGLPHFAAFPPDLPRRCLRLGTSEKGACPRCGAPWRRVLERKAMVIARSARAAAMGDFGKTQASGTMISPPECRTAGWRPSCACGAPAGVLPGDLDLIATPTGECAGRDGWEATGRPRPYRPTGGNGYERPRGEGEGVRPITQYERRAYAAQLRDAPGDVQALMREEAGPEAFAHYRKPGAASGRPLPPEVLERWLSRGWLRRVDVPCWEPPPPQPCLVLDPFCGSGTTGMAARRLGRRFVGLDLNPEYVELARRRIAEDNPLFDAAPPAPPPAPGLFDALAPEAP